MWHDDLGDEGEDGPEPGPLPDPSARHWRHPSELRNQHALPDPRPTPAPVGGPTATSSPVWPALAVGGVLAVAAVGVLGLQASLRNPGSLQADTAASLTAQPTATDGATRAAPVVNLDPTVTTSTRPTTTTLARTSSTASGLGAVRPVAPLVAEASEFVRSTPTVEAANGPAYGVYVSRSNEAERLGSFVAVAGEVVTSASALDARDMVWLRVESDWRPAWVIGTDPLTDVALLDVADGEIPLPWLVPAAGPIQPGRPAMIGYGDPTESADRDSAEPAPDAGDSQDDDRDDGSGPRGRSADAASPEVGTDDDNSGPGSGDEDGEDAENDDSGSAGGDDRADTDNDAGTDDHDGEDSDADDPSSGDHEADDEPLADRDWAQASERRGLIYSITLPLVTRDNRVVHESIMAIIDAKPGDVGTPLRNRQGEVVGLTIPGNKAQVAAVPIDRVLVAAQSLRQHGVGDPAWLGLEVTPAAERRGLVVGAVDERSPAGQLAPGDVIVAVEGEPADHPDVLGYAIRRAGPGGRLLVTVDRDRRRLTLEVEVGTFPATP